MFKFKGISSDEMRVIAEEEDFFAKTSQKYEQLDIDGRDGSTFNFLGYANIELQVRLNILDISKLDEILAWLNGKGEFEFQGRVTTAYFLAEINPTRVASIKQIDVTFIRSPFWQLKNNDFVECIDSIENIGNIYAEPLIRLEKKEDNVVDISINDIRFTYTFNDDEYVEINCETGNATYNNLYRNKFLEIGFEFPKLNPGNNIIKKNSGDCTIKIKNKDRFL